MDLFSRLTRYPPSYLCDPRENRLTEVTAAVIEGCPRFARSLVALLLTALDEERPDWLDADDLFARVTTQRLTSSGGFVDLEILVGPNPGTITDRFWIEVKHGADQHGDQLRTYLGDVTIEAGQGHVLVLAPRGQHPSRVPLGVPIVEWQTVSRLVRDLARTGRATTQDDYLLDEYATFLGGEALMDPDHIDVEHAFVLSALPTTEDALAGLEEFAAMRIDADWGKAINSAGRGSYEDYGLGYWRSYDRYRDAAQDRESWRSVKFEWLITTDACRDDGGYGYVVCAGATVERSRDNPATEPSNAEWLNSLRALGFEYVNDGGWQRIARFMYFNELAVLPGITEQVQKLSEFILDSFTDLASTPPPN